MERQYKLEIINKNANFMECKINDQLYCTERFRPIGAEPFYEPFFGWYVAEGWEHRGTLLVIYHRVGEVGADSPDREPDYSTDDGIDLFEVRHRLIDRWQIRR